MEEFKNLKEIVELSKEEIENNNKELTAILDLEDLKELKLLLEKFDNLRD